jgi:predicted aspartyl protease
MESMGEVRVRVRLANAMDEALVRRGELDEEWVRSYEAEALVDTGTMSSVLPLHVVQQLGLAIAFENITEYANGLKEIVGVTEPLTIYIDGRRTADEALVLGDEILIGKSILGKMDLLVDCRDNRLVPNPAHPDQPVRKVK